MAKVTYNPGPDDPQSVTWGGVKMEAGKAADVANPAILAKAKNNPFFDVSASKDEARQAEVVGGYADANTGEEVSLIRKPRTMAYGNVPEAAGIAGPSAATQGSTATQAAAGGTFEEVYGASREDVASGEHPGAPEYVGPEGTVAKRGRPPKGK